MFREYVAPISEIFAVTQKHGIKEMRHHYCDRRNDWIILVPGINVENAMAGG
jgi:hypothetical protein